MLFRDRRPETAIWKRFRGAADGFVFTRESDYYAAHLVANAERVVDLFLALLEHLPPAVDVVVQDARSGRTWRGERLPLPDVRDALARIETLLAAYGGVEVSVFTSEDQITLSPVLELFIYSRTDQWLYVLQGKGLEERVSVQAKSWRAARRELPRAPELVAAIATLADTLRLSAA
jgi:hypothetical protein